MSLKKQLYAYRPWNRITDIQFALLGAVWFVVCSYLLCLANAYMDSNNPYIQPPIGERIRLPDPLLDALSPLFDNSTLPKKISDTLVQVSGALIILRIVLSGKDTALMLRRICYTMGTTYLIRAPFIIMTVLPNPLLDCKSDKDPNYWYYALLLMIQIKYSCGDVLFSGHTIMYLTAVFSYVEFPLFTNLYYLTVQNFLFISYGFICLLSLVASSYHYTVDVVVSLMITTFIWKSYVYLATEDTFDHRWFGKVIKFIDHDRNQLPNDFISGNRVESTDVSLV